MRALRDDVAAGESAPSGSHAQQLTEIDDRIGLVAGWSRLDAVACRVMSISRNSRFHHPGR